MANSSTLILDFLAVLGGGRGPLINQIVPHVLGAFFWGILSLTFCLLSTRQRNSTDRLLLVGFNILFITGLSITASRLMMVEGYAPQPLSPLLMSFWFSLERFASICGRILISAALLQIVLGQRQLTIKYLKVSFGVIALALIYEQLPLWFSLAGKNDTANALSSTHIALVSQIPLTLLFGFAVYKSLGSLRKIRWPILIALSGFFLESILHAAVLHSGAGLGLILDPIRGHLQLWVVPYIAYVALRVRQVEGQRLENGIQVNERLEALGQLSSGIAHDFNNHLQIILGYVELAKSDDKLASKQQIPLNRIEDAAKSAGSLVNQLLAFSRGKPPKFEPVNLNEVVTGLTPMLSRLLGPNIRLMHDLDLNAQKVLADVPMIEQILVNLVLNSKDAIETDGTIAIESRSLSEHDPIRHTGENGYKRTQLLVSDTGMGMDADIVHRVFEPFYTTKPVGKGTGLGLSTVYSAVQKHNGTTFIKSELNKYTRVYLEFPVCNDTLVASKDEVTLQKSPPANGETILLAEDEEAIRDQAKALLQNAGYNVLLARDGQHALSVMNNYKAKIDLCVFDVTMPVINGYDTYDNVLKSHPDTPVLFITGNTSRVAHVRSNLPHLQKPFSNSGLKKEIRRILDTAEQT